MVRFPLELALAFTWGSIPLRAGDRTRSFGGSQFFGFSCFGFHLAEGLSGLLLFAARAEVRSMIAPRCWGYSMAVCWSLATPAMLCTVWLRHFLCMVVSPLPVHRAAGAFCSLPSFPWRLQLDDASSLLVTCVYIFLGIRHYWFLPLAIEPLLPGFGGDRYFWAEMFGLRFSSPRWFAEGGRCLGGRLV